MRSSVSQNYVSKAGIFYSQLSALIAASSKGEVGGSTLIEAWFIDPEAAKWPKETRIVLYQNNLHGFKGKV